MGLTINKQCMSLKEVGMNTFVVILMWHALRHSKDEFPCSNSLLDSSVPRTP